jgi:hypothetical protein
MMFRFTTPMIASPFEEKEKGRYLGEPVRPKTE